MSEREQPSRAYVPTAEQASTDPLLNACAHHGLMEAEVIEALFRDRVELMARLERLMLMQPGPVFVLNRAETRRVLEMKQKEMPP
jgi:hypothetical protein